MASNTSRPIVDSLVPLPNGKSSVWKYFGFNTNASKKITDKKKVYCKLCDPPFALAYSTNTSNLTYHLERKHPEEYRKVIGKKTKKPSKKLSATTPFLSISDSKDSGAKPHDKGTCSKRAKQLINATAKFISLSLQPIRVVDEPSFRNLLSTADPQFELPHRMHFSTKVIPD